MKTHNKERFQKIMAALRDAHWAGEDGEIDPGWQAGLMRHVRRLGSVDARMGYLDLLEQFLWKLTPAAVSLVLILGVLFYQMDFLSDYEIASFFTEDPLDASLVQLFNNG